MMELKNNAYSKSHCNLRLFLKLKIHFGKMKCRARSLFTQNTSIIRLSLYGGSCAIFFFLFFFNRHSTFALLFCVDRFDCKSICASLSWACWLIYFTVKHATTKWKCQMTFQFVSLPFATISEPKYKLTKCFVRFVKQMSYHIIERIVLIIRLSCYLFVNWPI